MGLLDKIKQDAARSGSNKGKFIFFKEGEKRRVRFLSDMEDGLEVVFHDNFEANINVPCQEIFGRTCHYCDEEGLRTRSQYIWSVWDYEAKEVKLFMYPMNNCSPLGAIAAMYENYGTLLDRDFIISVSGKQQNKTFSVVPMDKNKFRNEKAKPLSKSKILEILDNAYPDEHKDDFDDDEPKKSKSTKKREKIQKEEEELDYSEMTPKQLYALCEEREIEAEPKMKASYYINLLEEYDEENENDSDDWEDEDEEEIDYSEMSAKELYKLCQERDIEALPKKNEKYYINLLKENDKAHEDWEDEDENDEDEDW
jgi:hypothetical protein